MNSNYSLHIDDSLLHRARTYAQLKGLNLSVVIEGLLSKWTKEQSIEEKIANFPISAKVSSLAGRIATTNQTDDWKSRKEEYLREKHGL